MINIEKRGNIEIISFTDNKLNALTSDSFRQEVFHLFNEPQSKIIINLAGIEFIDSTGFATLLTLLRAAKNNYSILKLCGAEPEVEKLFNTLHLDSVFEIYSSIDECINSFS
ncbi:MAG TPA: STAS domain-containing protein [Bacteroidales bacterium]|nr:STAS domain-containing protein [Bacteroidales bacterium]HCI56289.1 hypothetical protein [Bacteroidales bacterium]HOU95262.1 STAS domain-containing protein [Bacteroidales bacterium]HQG35598.1 STAS domain-containing protein [Bacteroidales bacterium]HQG51908.1 STAS domain-containing protein [Bacteroidales bacterium]